MTIKSYLKSIFEDMFGVYNVESKVSRENKDSTPTKGYGFYGPKGDLWFIKNGPCYSTGDPEVDAQIMRLIYIDTPAFFSKIKGLMAKYLKPSLSSTNQ